jgi:hypothetical protein
MRHKFYREWLRLSIYDDLDEAQKPLLEEHLRACPDCRFEIDTLGKMHAAISEHPMEQVPSELLQEARRELQFSLATADKSLNNYSILGWTGRFIYPRYRLALTGVAVLLAGVILGYGAFSLTGSRPEPQAGMGSNTKQLDSGRIENLRFVRRGSEEFVNTAALDQDVEFTYDVMTQVRLKGKLRDSKIQKILALALVNERNPGVRLQSAGAISASGPDASDPEIQKALIDAMVHDENPGVRMQAMETLKSYPYQESIKKAFLHVLMNDKLPGLRIQAINALMAGPMSSYSSDPEIRNAFKERLVHDENPYIRLQARKFIQENSL